MVLFILLLIMSNHRVPENTPYWVLVSLFIHLLHAVI